MSLDDPVTVRTADTSDLPRIAAIYDEQVRTAISTFDLEPLGLDYWEARLASTAPGDHLLVALADSGVVGYAYSSSYRPRPAYARTREVSVYLAGEAREHGLGRALYEELLRRLRTDGIHQVLAVIAHRTTPARRCTERAGSHGSGCCPRWAGSSTAGLTPPYGASRCRRSR